MSDRIFKVTNPLMRGVDIRDWQNWLNNELHDWRVNFQLDEDGFYGVQTRSTTASIAYGLGFAPEVEMENGVDPDLRIELRHAIAPDYRLDWRDRFRDRYSNHDLHTPVTRILQDSWGWHPGVHDGVDLICVPNAPLLAICNGTIVRADASGWWGLGAPSDPGLKAKGDGIIILRSNTDHGMFVPGLNFCYGHAEHAAVSLGDKVTAGQYIGMAGFANAWHVHFMVNNNPPSSGFYRGVGDRDPLPYVNYSIKEQ